MIRFLLPASVFFAISFISCNNNREPGNSNEVEPEAIFFDYQLRGEEGNEYATLLLQFRFEGENGGTLLLEEPSRVELDGQLVPADSSKITGPYYEVQQPVKTFTGKHTIVYTDIHKKKHKEEFYFQPVELISAVGDTIRRGNMEFRFSGLESEDYIRLLLTDTSFTGEGINRLDTVRNGRLVISSNDLENLANGPIQLEFIREFEKSIRKGRAEKGRIVISYSIKREFLLSN